MNYLIIYSLLLVILVAQILAQTQCVGRQSAPTCNAPRNEGRSGPGCISRNVWYYDASSGQCRYMLYRGCGGNNNRWCTMAACEERCRR